MILRDANVAPDDASVKPPVADVHVVVPADIKISVNPHNNWNVVVGRTYELVVDIFDSHGHAVFPSDNVVVEFSVQEEHFSTESSTANGTHHSGRPTLVGTAEVTAKLVGVRDQASGKIVQLESPIHAAGLIVSWLF